MGAIGPIEIAAYYEIAELVPIKFFKPMRRLIERIEELEPLIAAVPSDQVTVPRSVAVAWVGSLKCGPPPTDEDRALLAAFHAQL